MNITNTIDEIKSIGSGFLERIRNPFGTTLILSWTLIHWQLIYSIFNFDDSYNLDRKLKYISTYLHVSHSGMYFGGQS